MVAERSTIASYRPGGPKVKAPAERALRAPTARASGVMRAVGPYPLASGWTTPSPPLIHGMRAGIVAGMTARKITIHVDGALLRRAQRCTREGVTATIRRGLELVAAGEAYDRLRALRGKVAFSVDLKALRQDRR